MLSVCSFAAPIRDVMINSTWWRQPNYVPLCASDTTAVWRPRPVSLKAYLWNVGFRIGLGCADVRHPDEMTTGNVTISTTV